MSTSVMICASCAAEIEVMPTDGAPAPCPRCGGRPWVAGVYRLDHILGRGASGTTYRATRVADGHVVCIKELAYNRLASFEVEARFTRECAVLRQLAHPGIPAYVDDLADGEGKARSLYLVQELVDGASLAAELASRRYREDEVLDIVAELADVLVYLHRLSPPVIHRDIKPSNVMRRADGGRLVLVDFGSVKDALQESVVGASVVGTFGFMPPEQLWGKATPASDLYALGALAVALLARREPLELVDERRQLAWREHVHVHPDTAALLSSLLAPELADRASRADVVRDRARALAERLRAPASPHVDVAPTTPPRPAPDRLVAPPRPAPAASLEPPAEVGSSSRWPLVLVLLAVGVAAVIALAGKGDERGAAASLGPSASVPEGLLGLQAGMSVEAARQALPELASAPIQEGHRWYKVDSLALVLADLEPLALPGPRLAATTLVNDTRAQCTFDFATGGLSRIECSLDAPSDRAAAGALTERVLAQIAERYHLTKAQGGCERPDDERAHSFEWMRRCSWSDARAQLEVKASWHDGMSMTNDRSELVIDWQSAAHRDLVSQLEEDARQRSEARRKADAAREEEERQKELERLRGNADARVPL